MQTDASKPKNSRDETIERIRTAPLDTGRFDAARAALVRGLESIGWEVRALEIDAANERVVMTLHRNDGRWLHVAGDARGATVERWSRTVALVTGGGRTPMRTSVTDEFLGRTRCQGFRSALRATTDYLSDNPAPNTTRLATSDIRRLLGPLLG